MSLCRRVARVTRLPRAACVAWAALVASALLVPALLPTPAFGVVKSTDQVLGTTVAEAPELREQAPDVTGLSGIVRTSSGDVLWARDPDRRRAPASTAKLTVMLVVLERTSLADMVTVGEAATAPQGSKVGLVPGKQYSVKTLLEAMLVTSACDASVALAEHVGGSESAFVALMNDKAAELGLSNTHYENCTGLDKVGAYTSARDLADLLAEAMRSAEFRRITTLDAIRFAGKTYPATNLLLSGYPGCVGGKTGTTSWAGHTVAARVVRGGSDVTAVVMGSPTDTDRYHDAATLLDWGIVRSRPGCISSYTTRFDPNKTARITNIWLAASSLDGNVVAPGAVGSFNGLVGERTTSRGFVEADAIVGGELIPQVGGGVCQVSTTLFNTVLLGSLPVVERQAHSMYFSGYPTARDATVSWRIPDLRFRNDTGSPVVVGAVASRYAVTIALYGFNGGARSTLAVAPLTEYKPLPIRCVVDPSLKSGTTRVLVKGAAGLDTSVTRTTSLPSGTTRVDSFDSRYPPITRVIAVASMQEAYVAVRGTLFHDLDKDGKRDAAEPGIPGRTIRLRYPAGGIAQTVTDPSGAYRFESLLPGAYRVFEDSEQPYWRDTSDPARDVFLLPGESCVADFGELQVGAVDGYVYDDIDGDGTKDAEEPPLVDAEVTLRDARGAQIGLPRRTGPDGRYVFEDIGRGSYVVEWSAPEGWTASAEPTRAVEVVPGVTARADALLGMHGVGISGTCFSDADVDMRRAGSEPGLAGWTVTAERRSGGLWTRVSAVQSGGDGVYRFEMLPPGEYRVSAAPRANWMATTPARVLGSLAGGAMRSGIDLGAVELGHIDLASWCDSDADGARDASEHPVAWRFDVIGTTLAGTRFTAAVSTNGSGHYRLGGLVPGQYRVTARKVGRRVSADRRTIRPGWRFTTLRSDTASVLAGSGETLSFGAIEMGWISGVVRQAGTRRPVTGVPVVLAATGKVTRTDSRGRYYFFDVAPTRTELYPKSTHAVRVRTSGTKWRAVGDSTRSVSVSQGRSAAADLVVKSRSVTTATERTVAAGAATWAGRRTAAAQPTAQSAPAAPSGQASAQSPAQPDGPVPGSAAPEAAANPPAESPVVATSEQVDRSDSDEAPSPLAGYAVWVVALGVAAPVAWYAGRKVIVRR